MRETLLIVDDEPINISVAAKHLSSSYSIKVAASGEEALRLVQTQDIDLILLDVVMPNLDGFGVAKILKENPKTAQIPIIFVTSKSDKDSIVEGFHAGAVDYISKPFSNEELLARVDTHIKIKRLQNSLEDSKKSFEKIFENSYNGVALIDFSGNFLLVNDAYSRITGFSKDELIGKCCFDLTHPDDLDKSKKAIEETIKNGKSDIFEKRCICHKDKLVYVNVAMSKFNANSILLNTTDVTELNHIHRKMEHTAEILDKYVLSSTTDLDGVITEASSAYTHILGFTKDEVIGKRHNITRHEDMGDEIFDDLWNTIKDNHIWRGEIKNRAKDKTPFWADTVILPDFDDDGVKKGYFAIRQIITSAKKLEELSITDELTQLYNRRFFNEVFEREFNRAKRVSGSIGFIMIDIDHFKLYNDTYGHQAGDVALNSVANAIHSHFRRSDEYSFRLGGEEFAVLCVNTNHKELEVLMDKIIKEVENLEILHSKNSASNYMTISAGAVFCHIKDGVTDSSIYKLADENLYKAKDSGRNSGVFSIYPTEC